MKITCRLGCNSGELSWDTEYGVFLLDHEVSSADLAYCKVFKMDGTFSIISLEEQTISEDSFVFEDTIGLGFYYRSAATGKKMSKLYNLLGLLFPGTSNEYGLVIVSAFIPNTNKYRLGVHSATNDAGNPSVEQVQTLYFKVKNSQVSQVAKVQLIRRVLELLFGLTTSFYNVYFRSADVADEHGVLLPKIEPVGDTTCHVKQTQSSTVGVSDFVVKDCLYLVYADSRICVFAEIADAHIHVITDEVPVQYYYITAAGETEPRLSELIAIVRYSKDCEYETLFIRDSNAWYDYGLGALSTAWVTILRTRVYILRALAQVLSL